MPPRASSRRPPRRRAAAIATWLLAVAAAGPAAAAQSVEQRRCADAAQRGLGAVLAARLADAKSCASAAGAGSVAACTEADRTGAVATALQAAVADEAAHCSAGALPDFGSAGAGAAGVAAFEASRALLRGVFGPDLDAALVPASQDAGAARCQAALIERGARCAEGFAAAYARCARRALRRADDAFDLVACKGAEPPACKMAAKGIARACRGVDPAPLAPGCGGDAGACVRGHARLAASSAVNRAAALCEGVLPGALDPAVARLCFEPAPPEPLELAVVPMPDGVSPQQPGFDATGELLVFSFRSPDYETLQLASMRQDGSEFRCLTCGAGLPAPVRGFQRLEDGQRVLVNGGNGASPSWRILEFAPSLLDCQTSALVPIELPPNPDPLNPALQYRVPHVTRDGGSLAWTEVRQRGPGNFLSALGRLEREADRYAVRDARVIAPPIPTLDLGDDADLWQRFAANYEAKEAQLRGGLDYVIASTPTAGQYGDLAVDLATGDVRRLTNHPDHDEGMELSPDESWYVLASAAGSERVEFLGLLPRPPYIDGFAFSIHFVGVAGQPGDGSGNPGTSNQERDCYLSPFLLDRYGQRGEYVGQRLLAPGPDGYEPSPGVAWHPDGTKLLVLESRWKRLTPQGEPQATRLRLVRLSARAPVDPASVVAAVPPPEPTWALRYEDYVIPDTGGVTVIRGKASGTATLTNELPSVVAGRLRVDYDRYSDDGENFLDGFEEISTPLLLGGADYAVDLRSRGRVRGSMAGAIQYDFVGDVYTGAVESRLGKTRRSGPRTCADAGLLPTLAP